MGSGQAVIPMMRNLFDPSTGTSPSNPRRHPNILTAYIDGSAVYGSEEERAEWLRSFEDGKLKVSQGNMLPYNTVDGELDSPIEEHAPEMDDEVRMSPKHFVAGDVRANENPLLLAFHTIFVREHNRICDELKDAHPDWTDEQLYQHARKIVGGMIQAIVYNEYLPAMGVEVPPYEGYDPTVHTQLSNTFTAAAFRLGHTLLNSNLERIMEDGKRHPDGMVPLREAFFNVQMVNEHGGIDAFLKGMAAQTQQQLDAKIVDDVRNFLFGPPGAGGLDLAAININRGRERGLMDFNALREALGLERYQIFQQINPENRGLAYTMLRTYQNVNEIDAWVGMLAEEPMPGALFGETIMTVMKRQFADLRDGDRFYYEIDPVLSEEEKEMIAATTLHDVIMRNTGIKLMQDEVFKSIPHEEICDNMTVEILGSVIAETGAPITGVQVALDLEPSALQLSTGIDGAFSFRSIPACDLRGLTINKNDQHVNGVSTFDMVLIQKHILGVAPFDSPYKVLAADVDQSGSVSTLDLIKMRKLILGMEQEFYAGSPWVFIPADYEFTDPSNPFNDAYPTAVDFGSVSRDMDQRFIGVKTGDVNNSAVASPAFAGPRSNSDNPSLLLSDRNYLAGDQFKVEIGLNSEEDLEGMQFALAFDMENLELVKVDPGSQPNLSSNNINARAAAGEIRFSWNKSGREPLDLQGNLIEVTFRAKQDGQISDQVWLSDRTLRAESYTADLQQQGLNLEFDLQREETVTGFRLLQNQPNPFRNSTVIPVYLPESGTAVLSIYDASGRELLRREKDLAAGYNEWELQLSALPLNVGVAYYQISSAFGTASRRMIIQR